MTQAEINKAYPALFRLCDLKLPIKKARGIYTLISKVKPHFEFALAEERKSIAEYNGTENPDGTISFNNRDEFDAYKARIDELNRSVVEECWDVINLNDDDLGTQTISPADIISLEGFVIFE